MTTLWHGRFERGPADDLLAYTVSLGFDVRLAADDLRGSRAHARMLAECGLLSEAERDDIREGLDAVEAELAGGTFAFVPTDEDVHTAVERRLTELTPAGAKLHTGRSRNDQVATDLRLFVRRAGVELVDALCALAEALCDRADAAGRALLPGYTHLQRAQPVLLASHLLAHAHALRRDADRVVNALRRANRSPLGAGALAGSTLPIRRDLTAADLGFDGVIDNPLDAVSDRDFAAETLFACALLQVHCSRLGEEIVLWSSQEFGFVRLPDEYATGSSMMPQKKNPDVAELARGRAGRVIGDLTALLVVLKGLPLAYNRDLQEDKEPLFDGLDTAISSLRVLAGLVGALEFDTGRMASATTDATLYATDVAEWLVARGVPFRDTHAIVGALVRRAVDTGTPLRDLVAADDRLGPEAAALLDPQHSAEVRWPAPAVADEISALRAGIASVRTGAADLAR